MPQPRSNSPRRRPPSSRFAGGAVAALALLLAGCGNDDPRSGEGSTPAGTSASPAPTATDPASEPPAATTTAPADQSPLEALRPCEVVDAAGLASLGLTGGEEKSIGQARVCRYRFEGPTLNETFTVSVELFDTYGLADIVTTDSEIQPLPPIGGHEARTFTEATGGCVVSLGVTDSSRVDATAVGGDTELACEQATALAAVVEPVLP
ncbi:DUF3558 family protein [Jiangella rhizosphaerae]|uniref:DUF3558 family protein n=1 Tax=Jiangella rhizosphaerae TaxID=2293569 RepID=UPI001313F5E8|nr:DUF3558 family protein [Jiangella rhizosphaerae]